MNVENLHLECSGVAHGAMRLTGTDSRNPLLYIHGAGAGSKERILAIADELTEGDISVLSFDQSGFGGDPEQLASSSLERRTAEALEAAKLLPPGPCTVLGSSMGAYVALKLLGKVEIKALILMYPAVYAAQAFSVPFGSGFRDIIREENSWQQTDVLESLRSFTGKLLIVIGTEDETIPDGVIDLLEANSPNVSVKETIRVAGAPHQLMEWLRSHDDQRALITQKIIDFSK